MWTAICSQMIECCLACIPHAGCVCVDADWKSSVWFKKVPLLHIQSSGRSGLPCVSAFPHVLFTAAHCIFSCGYMDR